MACPTDLVSVCADTGVSSALEVSGVAVELSLAPVTQTILVGLGVQGPPGSAPVLRLWADSVTYTAGMVVTTSKTPVGSIIYFLDGLFQTNLVVPDDLEEGDVLQMLYLYAN